MTLGEFVVFIVKAIADFKLVEIGVGLLLFLIFFAIIKALLWFVEK